MKFARDAIPGAARRSAAPSSTPMLICRRSAVPTRTSIWAFPPALLIWTRMLTRPGPFGPDHPGGPPRYGQNLFCSEHRDQRGEKAECARWRVFSLEMTKDQLVSRILSSEAAIDSQAFRTGGLSTADWEDLARASEVLAKTHIYLDDTSNITIPEMKAKIRRINQDPARPGHRAAHHRLSAADEHGQAHGDTACRRSARSPVT